MLFGLVNQRQENHQHSGYGNDDLDDAVSQHIGADGTDLFADYIIPNQNRQHPVGSFHRHIAEIFRRVVIEKGDLSGFPFCKIFLYSKFRCHGSAVSGSLASHQY